MNQNNDFDPSRTGRHPGGHPHHHPGRPDGDHEFGPRGPRGGGRGERRGDGRRGEGRGGRGRATRGDVRAAVLTLLGDEPMHGYQLMQAIGERSNGRWTPSPGAIYPVLSQLEDEALVTISVESGRKVATLTDAGRAAASEQNRDPFSQAQAQTGPDLRALVHSLTDAVRQVARTASPDQREKAAAVLTEARRALYLILADGPEAPTRDGNGAPEGTTRPVVDTDDDR